MSKIIVTYDSEILGSGEFWRGDASDIGSIHNYIARTLAERVIRDGVTRRGGMWTVSVEDTPAEAPHA